MSASTRSNAGGRRRLVALSCATALVTSALSAAVATGAANAGQHANAGSHLGAETPGGAVQAARHPSPVVLPTGERVTLRWAGDKPIVGRPPGARSRISFTRAGRHVYAVPVEAMPYLGAAFDRSLFDVTALAAAEGPDRTGRIPVRLTTTRAGVRVPGVHITSISDADGAATHATGSLDPGTAERFGAALRARLDDDPAGARRAGTPVPGLRRLALDAPQPRAVHPDFPMKTLTVRVAPPKGRTVLGAAVVITNVDDSRKYDHSVAIGAGNYAKVSVPTGNYTLVGNVLTAAADGSTDPLGPSYVPIVADYAVTGDGQSVSLDANDATATASFTTPGTSTVTAVDLGVLPGDGTHPSYGLYFSYLAEDDVRVQPTPAPAHGTLALEATEDRSAAPEDDSSVQYHLAADWRSGIPSNLHRTVARHDLARVVDVFHGSATADRVWFMRGAIFPDGGGMNGAAFPPGDHVDYLYGPPDVRWAASASRSAPNGGAGTEYADSKPVTYRPGRAYRVRWFQESLAPGLSETPTFPTLYCVACRSAGEMALSLSSETDSDPHHSGSIGSYGDASGWSRLRVLQDGTPIADEADTASVTVPVPAERHRYRIEYTLDRAALGFTTATHTGVTYTLPSSATSGSPVPADWYCAAGDGDCTVLPLLSTNVPLPTSRNGTMRAGWSHFVVRVGHVAAVRASAVTKLTFAAGRDGGGFHPAPVTALGHGRYLVRLHTPASAAGKKVSIRVHAEDAAGATITQTVTDAYVVAGS